MNFSLEMIEVYRFQSVSRVLYVHPSTGVSPHTPLSSPPMQVTTFTTVLFCLFWGYSFVSLTWLHTIVHILYNSASSLLFYTSTTVVMNWQKASSYRCMIDYISLSISLYTYTLRIVYMCRAKNDNEGTLYNGNELVLYTLWWWPHVATRGTESR